MTLFFPVLDGATALLWLVGSPALGYIVLRTAWPSCQAWNATLRAVASLLLGGGWSILALATLTPGITNPVSLNPNQIAEFSASMGMGLILLTLFAGLLSRFVWYRFIAPWNPGMMTPVSAQAMVDENEKNYSRPRMALPPAPTRTLSNLRAPEIESDSTTPRRESQNEKPVSTNNNPRVYKPSQLKLPPARRENEATQNENQSPKKYSPPPAGSSGSDDDVLGLLRDEAASEGKMDSRREQPEERAAPISQLGEFAGFDETLTQLKRDLKAFNESVDTHSRKKEAAHDR